MSFDTGNTLVDTFQTVFGPGVADDHRLMKFLAKTPQEYRFTIGQAIAPDFCPTDDKAALLSGRVRVLQQTSDGREQTAFILIEGDIWDKDLLEKNGFSMTVSSEDALVCRIPRELVLENAALSRQWWMVKYKANSLDSGNGTDEALLDSLSEPSVSLDFLATEMPEITEEVPEEPEESGILYAQQARLCLERVFEHYRRAVPRTGEPIQSVPLFIQLVETGGLQVRQKNLSWQQLLSADYPLVLVDEEGQYHWITGRKGNSLMEELGGETVRFVPDDPASDRTYIALGFKPKPQDGRKSGVTPYSLGWYLKLCVTNGLLSIQMVVSSLLVQIFALGMPIFYIVIFDRVFGRQNLNTLDIMAVGLLLLLVFDVLIKVLRAYVLSHQLEQIDRTGFEIFLERVFNIPLEKAGPQMTRSFTERFPEMVKMNQALASTLLITTLDVVFSIFMVLFLVILHPLLALLSLAPLVPMIIMSLWSNPLVKNRAQQSSQEQRHCQIKLTEVLENSETVQSLNAGNTLKWNIADKMEEYLENGFGARYDRVSGPLGQNFIIGIGTVVTLYFGAHEVLNGQITYGIYMAINMLSRQVIGSVQRLFVSILQFQEAMATMEHFKALYSADEVEQSLGHGLVLSRVKGHIKLSDVRFRYNPEAPWALNGVNLEIASGQKVLLTGSSGSGKTTLTRLLQQLYDPHSGYIALDGYNLADINLESLRKSVGVALQRPAIFSGTIRDNIALGNPAASTQAILEAATFAQLDQDLLRMPKGLDTPVAPMGANLSGGQVARIALARILLLKPGVLLMDEALAHCEPALKGAIYARILDRYRNATCVFITDYLPIHEKADKIVVLQDGQIVEQGTYAQLSRAGSYYSHLHHAALTVGGKR